MFLFFFFFLLLLFFKFLFRGTFRIRTIISRLRITG